MGEHHQRGCIEPGADRDQTFVGTLVQVGRGKRDVAWPQEVLALRDRRRAGMTAPARGLFLVRVTFRE